MMTKLWNRLVLRITWRLASRPKKLRMICLALARLATGDHLPDRLTGLVGYGGIVPGSGTFYGSQRCGVCHVFGEEVEMFKISRRNIDGHRDRFPLCPLCSSQVQWLVAQRRAS